jgi:hypothetical protein
MCERLCGIVDSGVAFLDMIVKRNSNFSAQIRDIMRHIRY